jgi:hypothetical protein
MEVVSPFLPELDLLPDHRGPHPVAHEETP